MQDLEPIRANLQELKSRWRHGEVPFHLYLQLRSELMEGLNEEQAAELATLTPMPPSSGTLGPSGGIGEGIRTEPPDFASFELPAETLLFDQWRIIEEVGRGGFGIVYKVEDLLLGSTLALKVLDPVKVAREDLLGRFQREVNVTRTLVHPGIVRVYDYRQDLSRNLALVSMEFLDGVAIRELNQHRRREKRFIPTPLVTSILEQTLEALVAAHRQKVIHRDITPGNIFLEGAQASEIFENARAAIRVKLLDFGIAALAEPSALSSQSRALGTVAYVAPEVLDINTKERSSSAIDVYGVGAVGYELFTGTLPLVNLEKPSVLRDDLPAELDDWLLGLLCREPRRRPNASTALDTLRAIRESVEALFFQKERWRFIERDMGAAIRAEDEALLKGILDSVDASEINQPSHAKSIGNAETWLQERVKERERIQAARRAEEQRLRGALRHALSSFSDAESGEDVYRAREELCEFLGDNAENDLQVRSVTEELVEQKARLEAERQARVKAEQEAKERAAKIQGALESLQAAIQENNVSLVEYHLEHLLDCEGDLKGLKKGPVSEAKVWLEKKKQEAEEARAQRIWEAQQLDRKNTITRLRKKMTLAIESEDERQAEQLARDLMATLGDSAASDRDLFAFRSWLEARERVRRETEQKRALRESRRQQAKNKERLKKETQILEVRDALGKALSLGVSEEVEIRTDVLRRLLGQDSAGDYDVQRATKWLKKKGRTWAQKGTVGAIVFLCLAACVLFFGYRYSNMATVDGVSEVPSQSSGTGRIEVRSNVLGDRVFLNDQELGATPQYLDLPPGHYTIKVGKDQCKGQVRSVDLSQGENVTLIFEVRCL